MRTKARVDANQVEIVKALRRVGCSVQPLHTIGKGAPDLLIGVRGKNVLMEVKDGTKPPSHRRLTPAEAAWHFNWRGEVLLVESVEQALAAVRPNPRGEK